MKLTLKDLIRELYTEHDWGIPYAQFERLARAPFEDLKEAMDRADHLPRFFKGFGSFVFKPPKALRQIFMLSSIKATKNLEERLNKIKILFNSIENDETREKIKPKIIEFMEHNGLQG